MHAATLFSALAIAGLGWALVTGNLTYRYAASWVSYGTPLPYRVGAVWVGPSGALLLWALVLGLGASIAAASLRRGSALRAWTGALLALLLLAVLGMAGFDTNPFLRLPFPPDDGRGQPLEWMRPIVLLQLPLGYAAMALVSVPAVMTVMGALGTAPWRTAARRWALACWALLGVAMLLDWRRRYGDGLWADDWRWAPVHDGTAFAWAGAALLVLASGRRWRPNAAVLAGFAAFTLGLGGLTLRRAMGWAGVHDFAASPAGNALGWTALAAVVLAAVAGMRAPGDRAHGTAGLAVRARRVTHAALLVAGAALVGAGFPRTAEIALQEGGRQPVTDRFGTSWSLSLEGVSRVGRDAVIADVVAVRAAVNGRGRAFVAPEVRSLFSGAGNTPTDQLALSGIAAGLAQDLRVDVRDVSPADAVVTVRFIPGVSWLWIAGAAAVIATLVAAFAGRTDDGPPVDAADAESAEPPPTAPAEDA